MLFDVYDENNFSIKCEYSENLLLKEVPGKSWDNQYKLWVAPMSSFIQASYVKAKLQVTPELKTKVDEYLEKQEYEKQFKTIAVCADCGSSNVYSIEFRTDYTNARSIDPLNDNEDIGNDDLPYYLSGHYCRNCESLCSIKVKKVKLRR